MHVTFAPNGRTFRKSLVPTEEQSLQRSEIAVKDNRGHILRRLMRLGASNNASRRNGHVARGKLRPVLWLVPTLRILFQALGRVRSQSDDLGVI